MRMSQKPWTAAGLLLALTLLSVPTWAENSMVDLNIMSSAFNMAYAVNELDQVAGAGYQNFYFGFVWDSGTETRLYVLSTWYTMPRDINDWRQVVGKGYTQSWALQGAPDTI